ncbi:hypothetical protein GCM10027072_77450 [Streptomyces bullii]
MAVAAARMLRRDGWRVVDLTAREGRPRLYARDRRGRELDVAFRPVTSSAATDEGASGPAPLREAGRPGVDSLIRVVIHLGSFSRTDVLWASRQGGVHLLDERQLQRWADGTTLDDLGVLSGQVGDAAGWGLAADAGVGSVVVVPVQPVGERFLPFGV